MVHTGLRALAGRLATAATETSERGHGGEVQLEPSKRPAGPCGRSRGPAPTVTCQS